MLVAEQEKGMQIRQLTENIALLKAQLADEHNKVTQTRASADEKIRELERGLLLWWC